MAPVAVRCRLRQHALDGRHHRAQPREERMVGKRENLADGVGVPAREREIKLHGAAVPKLVPEEILPAALAEDEAQEHRDRDNDHQGPSR